MNWIELIGLFAGLLGIIAWFPQIYRIWIQKRADGISIPTFTVISLALMLWLIYGFLIDSISLIISNSLTLILIGFVLIGSWKNQNK